MKSKYHNKRTNGFASKKESRRYNELVLLSRAGHIARLQTQVPFDLEVNGVKVCKYIADFCYFDNAAAADVVEDAKGMRTPLYRLKARLMKACLGITIKEV